MDMRRVIVHIERLVLAGFRYEDRHAISAGLGAALARVLATPEMAERLARMGDLPRLRVGPVTVAGDATPRQMGAAAAKAIGKGFPR